MILHKLKILRLGFKPEKISPPTSLTVFQNIKSANKVNIIINDRDAQRRVTYVSVEAFFI